MKKLPLILMTFSTLSTQYSFALNLSESPIEQVTLYPSMAKIEGSIPVQACDTFVAIDRAKSEKVELEQRLSELQ